MRAFNSNILKLNNDFHRPLLCFLEIDIIIGTGTTCKRKKMQYKLFSFNA